MKYIAEARWHRRSLRLKNRTYTEVGSYFVTICTMNKESLFGEIKNNEMDLSVIGKIVDEEWRKTPLQRPYVTLGRYVIMPNHFHAILTIDACRGTARCAPTDPAFWYSMDETSKKFGRLLPCSLGTIIRSFKSAVTKRINQLEPDSDGKYWQRNYYEHVTQSAGDLARVQKYILENPANWNHDEENLKKI